VVHKGLLLVGEVVGQVERLRGSRSLLPAAVSVVLLEGALAFGVVLRDQVILLLLGSTRHVGLVGVDLLLLQVL
jgi:hypothetical protein